MRMVRGIGWAAVWTVAGSILCMNAAVFSRWNGVGAVTPSARRTAKVSASPIRRSDLAARRSLGTDPILFVVLAPNWRPDVCAPRHHVYSLISVVETTHMPNAQPKRCSWVNVGHVLMREYHDREWGVPNPEGRTHFEFLILEAAQAGLNWRVVLNKSDGYRRAFSDFN